MKSFLFAFFLCASCSHVPAAKTELPAGGITSWQKMMESCHPCEGGGLEACCNVQGLSEAGQLAIENWRLEERCQVDLRTCNQKSNLDCGETWESTWWGRSILIGAGIAAGGLAVGLATK